MYAIVIIVLILIIIWLCYIIVGKDFRAFKGYWVDRQALQRYRQCADIAEEALKDIATGTFSDTKWLAVLQMQARANKALAEIRKVK